MESSDHQLSAELGQRCDVAHGLHVGKLLASGLHRTDRGPENPSPQCENIDESSL